MKRSSTIAKRGADPEQLLLAFAEPTRLRVLTLLQDGETCVCDLVAALALAQPTVSRHLAVLRRVGLVTCRKEGLWCHYSLAPASGALHAQLLECLACCREEVRGLAGTAQRCCELRAGRSCC